MAIENEVMMRPIRLLVVEDHEALRVRVVTLCQHSGTILVVGVAGHETDAVKQACQLEPDVVLMGYQLSDAFGITTCQKIRQYNPAVKILFWTSFHDLATLSSAISAGASGFMLKQSTDKQLIRAVETVAAGKSVVDPAMTDELLQLMRVASEPGWGRQRITLPRQQQRVLVLLAEGKRNREIAGMLALSEKTVINYVKIVFRKLGFTRRAQATRYLVQQAE